METPRKRLLFWLVCFVVGDLAGGCASSASSRRQDVPEQVATAEQPPDERAYREAAEKLLEYLDAQRKAGTDVVLASGKKDGIYPMYECMEYGCPDRVFCKETGAYCQVTHCGKGSCHTCSEPFPEIFKNIVFRQWCKFDCLKNSVRTGVAVGFIPSIGNIFIGPYCLED
jgi:hypothetical protein